MSLLNRLDTPQAVVRSRYLRQLVAILVAAILVSGAGLLTPPQAFAQSPPPGPLQGSGPWAENGQAIDTWEEYPGGMLLVFNPKWLFQAFPDVCGFSDTAVCYTWKQYHYFSADPYNTSYWLQYARGCMALGADPLSVGTADGISEQTDISSVGENWIPVQRVTQTDTATNSAAGGVAPAPDASTLPSPWTYERCSSGAGPGTGVVASCSMSYTGNWGSEVSTRTNTVTLFQTGQSLSVRVTAGPVFDDESSFLTDPAGAWTVGFTGNSSFNFVASSLKARLIGRTLSVSGTVAGPIISSTFGLEAANHGSTGGGWILDTCNMSL